jgi:DNA polymerase
MTPDFPQHTPDWSRLVALDFETYWDATYTLSKMSTSEYVRDKRFKAQMCGIKVGNGKTKIVLAKNIRLELAKINWATHSLLCHNTAFDGLILSHHYGVRPVFYYDSLSMARGLHSNDIGAGLDAVSTYYGGGGKIEGALEKTKGVLVWNKAMNAETGIYCANDVDEMLRVFKLMLPKMPADEIDLIDLTMMMFCDPVLKVDIPRVEAELKRELHDRHELLSTIVDLDEYDMFKILKTKKDRNLPPAERDALMIKKIIGSTDRFADLIKAEGVQPPVKISPAWMKLDKEVRESAEGEKKKYSYAFAKDDIKFLDMPNMCDEWEFDLNVPDQVKMMAARQERLQNLVDARIAVKSTSNITRAERFLTAGANGMSLPIGYSYYRAHTGRFGGNNKMNFQNLKRGGELRLSILAPKGHKIAVVDSGQIECRVNAWLWGQEDLIESFRVADKWDKKTMGVATGDNRDAYCKFADLIYGREITTDDKDERFVGKVCILGLGYMMGAAKLQITFAKGALGGPPVYFEFEKCQGIVNTYRHTTSKIIGGWKICDRIIDDMAEGRTGSHGPLTWEANTIWLPNGMSLKYPDLRQALGDKGWPEWTYGATMKGKKIRKKIYSGLLNENIVQALARIIVMWQMLQSSKKYRVVMTTHDEFACIAKNAQADKCFAAMTKWMKTPPWWCPDIPLNSEGKVDVNYSK